jgi:hypothetical protein
VQFQKNWPESLGSPALQCGLADVPSVGQMGLVKVFDSHVLVLSIDCENVSAVSNSRGGQTGGQGGQKTWAKAANDLMTADLLTTDVKKARSLTCRTFLEVGTVAISAWWRKRVVAVAVALADTTVLTVDQNFAFLVDRNIAGRTFGFCLSTVVRGVTLVSFAAHGPAGFARDYMLIFTGHFKSFQDGED